MSAVPQVIGLIETHCDLDRMFAEFPASCDKPGTDRFRADPAPSAETLTVAWADLVQLQADLEHEYWEVVQAHREHLVSW